MKFRIFKLPTERYYDGEDPQKNGGPISNKAEEYAEEQLKDLVATTLLTITLSRELACFGHRFEECRRVEAAGWILDLDRRFSVSGTHVGHLVGLSMRKVLGASESPAS